MNLWANGLHNYDCFVTRHKIKKPNKGNHQKKTTDSRVWTQVILYSGEPLSSLHVEMAYLNTCAKRYSILFKWSSALIFSNRVPNCRHESLDVFRILLTLRPYPVMKQKSVKNASKFAYIKGKNGQYLGHA